MSFKNKSPLRYPGGKTRACKKLEDILIKNFDISNTKTLISPFFGGGSFEFFLQNKYNLEIIANDKFKPLYNFWNTSKNNKLELCSKLYDLKEVSSADFSNFRSIVMNEENDLQQAYYYFIINRCSFSGATLSGGFSLEASKKRFTKSSIDRVNALNLSKVEFNNLDFSEFIESNSNLNNLDLDLDSDSDSDTIIFLDPPYYLEKGSNLYGNNGDMHETFNHKKLYECLKDKNRWIMTYNNCNYIKEIYKDYIIVETDWKYGMNKSKESSEIVIIKNN